ncbi:MAG: AAA family ATPase [Nanohaloarchaea archaeon]|nr:AAA family ATPase [Candidatus Nanohaloarchaea archaeon]
MTEIYGVTGMPLSGKTTVADIMKEQLDFTVLDMGEVVRIEMNKRNIPTEKTGEFVNEMRDEHGGDAIAQLSIPYLEEMIEEQGKIVITGMRGWNEKQRFENELESEIKMVATWAPRKTRKERREERQREEDKKGDDFEERDIREIENGVGKLMALSDIIIKNDGISLEELELKVKNIVES